MTITIKRRSGGTIAGMIALAELFHGNMAEMYREKYAAVPVKVRKHRMTEERIMAMRAAQQRNARSTLMRQRIKDMIYD